jgi:hypothetical protein
MAEEKEIKDVPPEIQPPKDIEANLTPKGIAAMQGDTKAGKDWVERGIVDVPMADLPSPEGVSSPADFDHHIAWQDAQSATKQIPEIQKAVKDGKTGDDFFREDQAANLDYAHGKQRTYDLFYGSDAVKLDKVGDQYTIVSGRHRIFAAKDAGLETIPARVSEKVSL